MVQTLKRFPMRPNLPLYIVSEERRLLLDGFIMQSTNSFRYPLGIRLCRIFKISLLKSLWTWHRSLALLIKLHRMNDSSFRLMWVEQEESFKSSCVEFFILVFTLADGLGCAWFIYRILYWCWCPEIGTSYTDWAQLIRLICEDGGRIQSLKRRLLNKNRTMVEVQKLNNCIRLIDFLLRN
jgi:hypothetical protein